MIDTDLPLSDVNTSDTIRLARPGGARMLDLDQVFGNTKSVELEIGTGKGRFILLAAASQPDVNYLGVEYASKYLERAIARCGKRGITNVRLVHDEALRFMTCALPTDSISCVHVYFPDPWPKKRHHKRRFFRAEMLAAVARVLAPDGLLKAATDHAKYADAIGEAVAECPYFDRVENDPAHWELPGMSDQLSSGTTNFEIKYRREGRDIRRFVWRRNQERAPESEPLGPHGGYRQMPRRGR